MADALSRRICDGEESEGVLAIITFPNPEWVDKLKANYSTSLKTMELLSKLTN